MRFMISREVFAKAVERVASVTERKTTLTILSQVKLTADKDGTVKLEATDYDVVVRQTVPAEVVLPGVAVLPGRLLLDMVKALPKGSLTFSGEQTGLLAGVPASESMKYRYVITSGASKLTIGGTHPDDYPMINNKVKPEGMWQIPAQILSKMVKKVSYAMSQEEGRMNLNGVYFEFGGKGETRICMSATDGHRLTRMVSDSANVEGAVGGAAMERIVHRRGIGVLEKILDDSAGMATIGISESDSVVFGCSGVELFVRCIDENFPDIDSVFPDVSSVPRLTMSVSDLNDAMSVVKCTLDPNLYTVRLLWDNDKMVLKTSNHAGGEAEGSLFVESENASGAVGFNYKYLSEMMKTIDGEKVVMHVINGSSPVVIKPYSDGDGISVAAVLMPVEEM